VSRNVNCGVCVAPLTCGGGGGLNQCGCAPESNTAFCTRNHASCGRITAQDNCGVSRTVNCGSGSNNGCLPSTQTCNSNHQCVCYISNAYEGECNMDGGWFTFQCHNYDYSLNTLYEYLQDHCISAGYRGFTSTPAGYVEHSVWACTC